MTTNPQNVCERHSEKRDRMGVRERKSERSVKLGVALTMRLFALAIDAGQIDSLIILRSNVAKQSKL